VPTRYVKDIIVDPATAALMSKAFEGALAKLSESSIVYPGARRNGRARPWRSAS